MLHTPPHGGPSIFSSFLESFQSWFGRSSDLLPAARAFPCAYGDAQWLPFFSGCGLSELTAAGLSRTLTWFPFHAYRVHPLSPRGAVGRTFRRPNRMQRYEHFSTCIIFFLPTYQQPVGKIPAKPTPAPFPVAHNFFFFCTIHFFSVSLHLELRRRGRRYPVSIMQVIL